MSNQQSLATTLIDHLNNYFNLILLLLFLSTLLYDGFSTLAMLLFALLTIGLLSTVYILHRLIYIQAYDVNDKLKFFQFCLCIFLDGSKFYGFNCSLYVLFRALTYKWRVLPNVIILGEQKCGTTTAAYYLRTVLGMQPPFAICSNTIIKDKDTMYFRGLYGQYAHPSYYSMCFPLKWFSHPESLYFEACPSLLFLPFVRDRIYKLHQQHPHHLFKFIIMVRDPVDRAISAAKTEALYRESIFTLDKGVVGTFAPRITSAKPLVEFCQTEWFHECAERLKKIQWNERLPDWYTVIERGGIIQRGMYSENIEWLFECELFRNNTLILDMKELSESPAIVMKKVAQFIGMDANDVNVELIQHAHLNKAQKSGLDDDINAQKILRGIYGNEYRAPLTRFDFIPKGNNDDIPLLHLKKI
eukprot:526553_1